MLKGMIVKNISNIYRVQVDNKYYDCEARGKFRKKGITLLVGDFVLFDEQNKYILDILPRKNELDRPSISNIDIALLVTSVKKPDLSLYLLDKLLTVVYLKNVIPVICFTKLDCLDKKELKSIKNIKKYYEKLGIKVFNNQKLGKLLKYLKGKTVVLTGQTGAGKSSLLNAISPSLNLKTGEISDALGRGKHTTRHTEFYLIRDILIADTPGFSALDLKEFSKEDIRDAFLEFKSYQCEYKNCMHDKEECCKVKQAVEEGKILKFRYENYLKLKEGDL